MLVFGDDEVHFDADAAAACLRVYDSLECKGDVAQAFGTIGATEDTCGVTFCGDEDVDGPCTSDEQGKLGLQCDKSVTCPGTCARRPTAGEACDVGGIECAKGLTCFEDVCAPQGQAGDAYGTEYPACTLSTSCETGSPTQGCVTYTTAEPGAPCTGFCTEGCVCSAPSLVEPKVCHLPAKLGEPCIGYADCEPGIHCTELFEGLELKIRLESVLHRENPRANLRSIRRAQPVANAGFCQ